jgi:hypothetical protein
MRGRWSWIGWGIVVLGLTGLPVWGAEPEAVRRLMEQYEREAEAEKTRTAPAPMPRPPAPRPRPPAPAPFVQPEPRWINSELANVRSGPGAGHRAITQLPRGSEVTWLGASTENPAWQRIRLSDGRVAYVYGNLLSRQRIAAAPEGKVRGRVELKRKPDFRGDLPDCIVGKNICRIGDTLFGVETIEDNVFLCDMPMPSDMCFDRNGYKFEKNSGLYVGKDGKKYSLEDMEKNKDKIDKIETNDWIEAFGE